MLKRGRAPPFIHPTTPSRFPHTLISFSWSLRQLQSHAHATTFAVYSSWAAIRAATGEAKGLCSSLPLDLGGPTPHLHLHTTGLSKYCGDPHSVCIPLYPLLSLHASLETQLVISFVAVWPTWLLLDGQSWQWSNSSGLTAQKLCKTGPHPSQCRGCSSLQGSGTSSWAKVTPQGF